jgi:hypothetical protein
MPISLAVAAITASPILKAWLSEFPQVFARPVGDRHVNVNGSQDIAVDQECQGHQPFIPSNRDCHWPRN